MRFKYTLFYLFVFTFISSDIFAQNMNPDVSNVSVTVLATTVTVSYDVADSGQNIVTIIMNVSTDDGTTWNFDYGIASGDIGTGVSTGIGKSITWTYNESNPEMLKIKIIANDETAGGSPCPNTPTVTFAGKTYNTIQIGDQCWLNEALDVGNMLQNGENSDDNQVVEKYCYDNDQANCTTYGALYQWNEAVQYVRIEGTQGICPDEWHIPTNAEIRALFDAVNGDGNALKAIGQGDLIDGVGTNTSGFSGMLSGRKLFSSFSSLDKSTYFWSSKEEEGGFSKTYAHRFGLQDNNGEIIRLGTDRKETGYSIRCIQGEGAKTPVSGEPCPDIPTVEYEGKTYNTMQIGYQCWLKENLDVGTVVQGIDDMSDDGLIQKYCYDNNPSNCNTYGALYQWNEAMQYVTNSGSQGICPDGWHIPTNSELKDLIDEVDENGNDLKSEGEGTGDGAGTNASGFSGLLAGSRYHNDGNFNDFGDVAYLWSSTMNGDDFAKYMELHSTYSNINLRSSNNNSGYSVRCLKD